MMHTGEAVNTLKVEHPCPVAFMRLRNGNKGYFCDSCSKTLVDFRQATTSEIKQLTADGVCGIFTQDQLAAQRTMKFSRKLIFYSLTLLSFLGFSVKPLKAGTIAAERDSSAAVTGRLKNGYNLNRAIMLKKSLEKPKALPAAKKKQFKVIGCPSF